MFPFLNKTNTLWVTVSAHMEIYKFPDFLWAKYIRNEYNIICVFSAKFWRQNIREVMYFLLKTRTFPSNYNKRD